MKRFDEIFLLFCNFLVHVHLFNSFLYPNVFLRLYIHNHLVLRFFLLFINIIFFQSLFICTQVPLECLRDLVIVIFCSICLHVLYSYKRKSLTRNYKKVLKKASWSKLIISAFLDNFCAVFGKVPCHTEDMLLISLDCS